MLLIYASSSTSGLSGKSDLYSSIARGTSLITSDVTTKRSLTEI